MTQALLPSGSTTDWESALADAMPPSSAVLSAIGAMRRFKYVSPRPDMLPFLVWEYGLGELTPYVPNLYDLIDQGVRWQRLRGTVSAVAIGLAWIGYTASIEEAWTGRRFWNSFQLRFPTLPVADSPDLERIEGITALSVPLRSKLRRGVHQYDVGALEADHSALDGSMLDTESGIAVTQAGTVWSFGRTHEFEHVLSEIEGVRIGNWIEPPVPDNLLWGDSVWLDPSDGDDGELSWGQLDTLLWVDADFLWATASSAGQRRISMSAWFNGQTIYMRFKRADGSTMGLRRCRAVRVVRKAVGGHYAFADDRYVVTTSGEEVYIEALTQFDDANGQVCAGLDLMIGGYLADEVPIGRQWLSPDEHIGGEAIASKSVSIPLRRTVREQIKFLMRF